MAVVAARPLLRPLAQLVREGLYVAPEEAEASRIQFELSEGQSTRLASLLREYDVAALVADNQRLGYTWKEQLLVAGKALGTSGVFGAIEALHRLGDNLPMSKRVTPDTGFEHTFREGAMDEPDGLADDIMNFMNSSGAEAAAAGLPSAPAPEGAPHRDFRPLAEFGMGDVIMEASNTGGRVVVRDGSLTNLPASQMATRMRKSNGVISDFKRYNSKIDKSRVIRARGL